MNNFLYVAIYNTVLAIVGLIMGIFFIGLPCLVFIYLAGYWTGLAILNYRKHAYIRRTNTPSGEQQDA
jgi:hypothetical protein